MTTPQPVPDGIALGLEIAQALNSIDQKLDAILAKVATAGRAQDVGFMLGQAQMAMEHLCPEVLAEVAARTEAEDQNRHERADSVGTEP